MFPDTMFPETEESNIDEPKRGKSFLFDFMEGEFVIVDGKLVRTDKIEALRCWIEKIIRTEKFKFRVYKTGGIDEYGIRLIDFTSSVYPMDFIKVEIKREIKETLSKNEEIKGVHNFLFSQDKRTLVCEFTADTVYGEIESKVTI